MRHAEPSPSSTIWLLSCFLMCIAGLQEMVRALDLLGAGMSPIGECSSDYWVEARMR
jgi:hypothetical protein